MRMVELDNTKRATYTRNHDERVCEIQFPVGWTFFTRTNIDAILKRLAAKGFKVDMAYITPLLQWAYESRGRTMEGDRASLQQNIKQLNDMVEHRVMNVLHGDATMHREAVNIFFGRNMRPIYNPHSEPSMRLINKRSVSANVAADPGADASNIFGA